MSEPEVEALARRLDRLERGLRRWRIVGGVAWAALAACVGLILVLLLRVPEGTETAEAPEPDARSLEGLVEEEVKARAFVLVDDEGRPRAALAIRPDGTPALAFTAEDGRITWKAP